MDPLTHGLLGASAAISFSKRKNKNLSILALCGIAGAMAPDLDVFIHSDTDPLLAIEFHRHFTHALPFVPIGGLLVAAVIYAYIWTRSKILPCVLKALHKAGAIHKYNFKTLYIYCTLGYFTHGLLDACTAYGTRLYWPISNLRVSWNFIAIIDPAFTLPLLIFLILCFWRKSVILMRVGLIISLSYLTYGAFQHYRVENYARQIASERGDKIERITVNPTIGNDILWRSVYQYDGKYHVDAVFMPPFGKRLYKQGAVVPTIDANTVFPSIPADSQMRNDILRFAYFAQGYIFIYPENDHIISDLRYGTLPDDTKSIWGIKIDEQHPERHVDFVGLRAFGERHYEDFWLMLNGNL